MVLEIEVPAALREAFDIPDSILNATEQMRIAIDVVVMVEVREQIIYSVKSLEIEDESAMRRPPKPRLVGDAMPLAIP